MTMVHSPETQVAATEQARRRQVRREIVLPFAGGFVFVLLLVGVAALLFRQGGTGLVANLLLTVLVLCPLALCVFPFTLVMVAAMYGVGKLNTFIYRPLRGLEGLSVKMNQTVARFGKQAVDKTIDLSAAYEKFDRLVISQLDTPDPSRKATPIPVQPVQPVKKEE